MNMRAAGEGVVGRVGEFFGMTRRGALAAVALVLGALALAVVICVRSAPSTTIRITTGPEGSASASVAEKYAKVLAKEGIKLRVLPSHGSLENVQRLRDPAFKVDVGFVQDGAVATEGAKGKEKELVSLGSVAYQPLMVFTRDAAGGKPIASLADLAGRRVVVGEEGSGTRQLALTLLAANGIEPGGKTELLDQEPQPAIDALLAGQVDAIFLMGESVSGKTLRQLMLTPGIRPLDFAQAEAYARRFTGLSVLKLPEGSIDFARNIPDHDISLVSPTVELVARKGFHPALSDVLLEAAQEVNGKAGLLQRRGEFPAALEHDFPLSDDAARFYRSGKSFFYHYLPFWLASLTSRIVVVVLPIFVIAIPVMRSLPKLFRWRMQAQIYRWYRAMLALERDLLHEQEHATPANREEHLRRLDEIEQAVNRMKVPAFFADQFYALRGHIAFVRRVIDRPPSDG